MYFSKYPYIHSVSFVGIIHHNRFDYLLHPFRTDITGESGTGKSMIADVLQLIFVGGKTKWRSTTAVKTDAERTIDKLVLNQYGYVFLNAAVEKDQFVAFGVRIQKESGQMVSSFIVQQHTPHQAADWEQLKPFSTLLTSKHFLSDDQQTIVNKDDIVSHLKQSGFNYRSFHTKDYHWHLSKNKLLPVDLSDVDYEQQAEHFSRVLQSFARGELDITNGDKLKDYLFDEITHNIKENYEDAAKSIEKGHDDYLKLTDTVNALRAKRHELQSLDQLEDAQKRTAKRFFSAKIAYHYDKWQLAMQKDKDNQKKLTETLLQLRSIEFNECNQTLQQDKVEFGKIEQNLSKLKERIETYEADLNGAKNLQEPLKIKTATTKKAWEKALSDYTALGKIQKLIRQAGSKVLLLQKFTEQTLKATQQQRFKEISDVFSDFKLLNWFQESPFYTQTNAGYDAYYEETRRLRVKKERLEQEITLFNLDQNNSLIQWVIQQQKPLSKKQEALLFHCLEMPLIEPLKPKLKDQFIANPAAFMDSATDMTAVQGGFWWQYHGIKVFVAARSQYIFEDLSQIAAYFKQKHAEHKKAIADLIPILERREKLLNTLQGIGFVEADIQILKDVHLKNYVFNAELAKETKESLEELLDLYRKEEHIERVYEEANERYLEAAQKEKDNNKLLSDAKTNLDTKEADKKNYLTQLESKERTIKKNEDKIAAVIVQFEKHCAEYIDFLPNYILKFSNSEAKLENLFTRLGLKDDMIKDKEKGLLKDEGNLSGQTNALKDSIRREEKNYRLQLDSKEAKQYGLNDFNAETYEKINEHTLTECEENYEKALKTYEQKYDYLKETYKKDLIHNLDFKSEQNRDTFVLAQALLGTKLIRERTTFKADLENKIELRIQNINEQLSEINKTNAILIRNVLHEITKVHKTYKDKSILYNNFLKINKLANGRYVELDFRKDKVYQLDWVKDIVKQIDANENTFDLFQQQKDASSKNVDEILMDMFKKTVKQAHLDTELNIKNLLEPKSYFELGVHLKLADGTPDSQSGGTGHGMIILISAARFVLMQQKHKNKKFPKGLRYIPIDEVADLGENFELLREIAKKHGFQLIIFSIDSFGRIEEQNGIYMYELRKADPKKPRINPTPLAIFNMQKGMTDMDHLEKGDEFVQKNYQDFLLNSGIIDGN